MLKNVHNKIMQIENTMIGFEKNPIEYEEISDMAEEFRIKIWYDRNQYLLEKIETGETKVNKDKAIQAAKEIENKYGTDNLGPYTDFEWGVLNGKLSALRWVLGYEWDTLDT